MNISTYLHLINILKSLKADIIDLPADIIAAPMIQKIDLIEELLKNLDK